jgi:ubiquinone/menaquinone biosynthesis C-methylase UbiE
MNQPSQFWDKLAHGYAEKPVDDEAAYQRKLKETQALFTPDMRLLEFGCGTGTTAIHHAPLVESIVALDFSQKMIEIGQDKAQKAQISNIHFHQSTLEDFEIETDSFDVVLGLNILHLVTNRNETIKEAYRALKPGGYFVSSTVCLGHSYLRLIKWLVPLGKRLGKLPDLFIIKDEELIKELQNEGFTIENHWTHGSGETCSFIIARK